MKVAPPDSFPATSAVGEGRLFEDHFLNMGRSSMEELCPVGRSPSQISNQRIWSSMKELQCHGNTAFCWMDCLDIPNSCNIGSSIQCLNSDNKPCCTDTITTNCADMDQSCHWQCNNSDTKGFCNGVGTDMYMKGFTTSGDAKDACVILLFKSWVLDTRIKFSIACVGVIALGIAIEGLLCLRRELQSRKILLRIRGMPRRVCIIMLFALNIGSGYLAMLVAMTYSVELFICMVIGLVLGHAIFNTEAAVGETVDPCCASQAVAPTKESSSRVEEPIDEKSPEC